MPLSRYQIRNEYSLADPELYGAADKDDPEALLEGVAMAGLVGVLRQLGDLSEFAAEIFHGLHEEVMTTAARGHGLMVRVQQLETEFPLIEKAFLSQTSHSSFFYNAGVDWHPNLPMDQNLITREGLPRFIMDSYEECRGPPRLFLLDKFDVAGAGACLKRYTDPSFFKIEASSFKITNAEVQREKKTRRVKKKGSRWRNQETPDVLPTSHAKLHQLFLEERVENGISDPARHVKLKRRLNGFPFDSTVGKSYMEKFLKTPSPQHEGDHEILSSPLRLPSNVSSDSGAEIHEISVVTPVKESMPRKSDACSSSNTEETVLKPSIDELHEDATAGQILTVAKLNHNFEQSIFPHERKSKTEGSVGGYHSDDIASEIDNYMDALTTMESETDTDNEVRLTNDPGFLNVEKQGTDSDATEEQLRAHFSDSQSITKSTASDDGNCSFRRSISSFSYSDTRSTSAENVSLDGDISATVRVKSTTSDGGNSFRKGTSLAKNATLDCDLSHNGLPSEIYESEIIKMSFEDISTNQASTESQPRECLVSNGASVEIGRLSELRGSSSYSSLLNSAATFLPANPGGISMYDELAGEATEAASSNCQKGGNRIPDNGENGTSLGENSPRSTSNLSDVPSQRRDDFQSTMSAEVHPQGELCEDLNVFSDDSVHTSNLLDVVLGKKSDENVSVEVIPTEDAEDNCNKNFGDTHIISADLLISQAEEQPFHSASAYYETCASNGMISKVFNAIPSVGGRYVNLNAAVDGPGTCKLTEERVSEITDVPLLELDSAEVRDLYSGEKNVDGLPSNADGEELGEGSPSMDMVGSDASVVKFPSDSLNSLDSAPMTGVRVHLDETEARIVKSETLVVTAAVSSLYHDDIEENASSPSPYPGMLQEESVSSIGGSYENELKINNTRLPENHDELGTQEVSEKAVASTSLGSIMCDTVSSDHFGSHLLSCVPESSLVTEAENSLHVHDASMVPPSLTQGNQDSESESPQQSNLIDNVEDVHLLSHVPDSSVVAEVENSLRVLDAIIVPSSSEQGIQESEFKFLQMYNLVDNIQDTHLPTHVNDSSLVAEAESSLHVHDAMIVPSSSSEQSSQDSVSNSPQHSDHIEDSFASVLSKMAISSPDSNTNLCSTVSDDQSEIKLINNVTDSSLAVVLSVSYSSLAEPKNGVHLDAVTGVPLSFEHSSSESESSQQCTVSRKPEDAPSSPAHHLSDYSPSGEKVILQDNPLGVESLHSTQASSKLFPLLEQIQPSKHINHESQFVKFPRSCSEDVPSPLSVSVLLPHGNQKLDTRVGSMDPLSSIHPGFGLLPEATEISLEEMPPLPPLPPVQWRMGKHQQAALASERDAMQHQMAPFPLILSSTADEKIQTGNTTEEEKANQLSNSFLPFLAVNDASSQHAYEDITGNVVHPDQLSVQMPTAFDQGSGSDNSLTLGRVQSVNPFLALPAMNIEIPRHGSHAREGEKIQLDLRPFSSVTATGDSNYLREKPCEPPYQMSPETSSNHITLGCSSGTREGEVANPHNTMSPLPTTENGQRQHVFPNSDGEIPWSAVEHERTNGNRSMKLPRPRNPLIDAVIAHDKSKLRKVTEQVCPQIQKLDENDSLLEQIRTKSFNLKPAVTTRPSIQGPRTNLKVAAILEKANAIRQALAGSDEDDDENSWSDS